MKRIVLKNVEEQLQKLNADTTSITVIINNVRLYNDTLKSYDEGNKKEKFYIMQVNAQILKQMEELRKIYISKTQPDIELDPLQQMIDKIENLKNEE